MEISVILPVYKVEAYLSRCVDSILAQSFTDFELILVDDGSPDNCGKICDEYDSKDARIRVIHQQNGGLSAARNSGIDIATGQWLTFIDSDDWIHPDYLKVLYAAATNNNLAIAIGKYEEVYDGTSVDDSPIDPVISVEDTEGFWVGHRTNATVAWGKLYKRSIFGDTRYPVGKIDEDEYTTFRVLFQNDSIAYVDEPIYRYYQNPNGISKMNYVGIMDDVTQAFYEQYCYFKNSEYKQAYKLSIEMYADSVSQGIWIMKQDKTGVYADRLADLRKQLRAFLEEHPKQISFDKRKDIYISAYPKHEVFIRGFGFLKQKLTK